MNYWVPSVVNAPHEPHKVPLCRWRIDSTGGGRQKGNSEAMANEKRPAMSKAFDIDSIRKEPTIDILGLSVNSRKEFLSFECFTRDPGGEGMSGPLSKLLGKDVTGPV